MSPYSFFAVRRFWLLVPAALLALAVFFAPPDSARPTKAVAQASRDAPPLSSARPSAGPTAVKSTVDLRTLPHTTSARGGALPFRHPRGVAALASEQAAARRIFPPTPVAGVTHVFDALAFGALAVLAGFNGISSEESGGSGGPCFCVPPDGDMAVGPNHVLVDVNQAFRVFDKSGMPLTNPVGMDTFFSGCGPAGLTSSDAMAAYDPVADRFTVGILRYDGNTQDSYVSLAVTQSGDPTTAWNLYCFEQTYQGIGSLYDFPHISVGQTALFTTGNLYPPNGEVNVSARVNAYPKLQMYAGLPTVTQVYTDVVLNSDLTQADTIRPALFNVALPSPTNYFINSSSAPGSSRISVWRWTDPFGANLFDLAGGVDVAPYVQPISMLQPPPGQPMPPGPYIDDRTLGAMWHAGTVYSTHTIGCNSGSGLTDCVQWYQVGNLNGAPTLVQQGIISGTNESRTYPNLAIDQYGNVELTYAFSSLNDYIGIRHTGRLAGDPSGQMGPEGVIKAGEQAETGYNALRWGDFTGSVVDPDGVTLWHFQEYSQAINDPLGSWGTWTSASRFPAPSGTPTATPTGTPVPGSVLIGHVEWQGPPSQPDGRQQLPVTLTLKSSLTEVNYPVQTTDASGFFTVSTGSLLPGSYSYRVKGPIYLANSGTVTILPGTNRQEMGLVRAGDADNNNLVNSADFNILRQTFGIAEGTDGYDSRADFNNDDLVNVADFNLLRNNFGVEGAPPN